MSRVRTQKLESKKQDKPKQQTLEGAERRLPVIVSTRTGLIGADDAITRKLPVSYQKGSVRQALDYILHQKGLDEDEKPLAKSLEKEMRSENFVVVVNGKNAELTDKIAEYLVKKEHQLPNGQVKAYNALEIEVSSIQQGGSYKTW